MVLLEVVGSLLTRRLLFGIVIITVHERMVALGLAGSSPDSPHGLRSRDGKVFGCKCITVIHCIRGLVLHEVKGIVHSQTTSLVNNGTTEHLGWVLQEIDSKEMVVRIVLWVINERRDLHLPVSTEEVSRDPLLDLLGIVGLNDLVTSNSETDILLLDIWLQVVLVKREVESPVVLQGVRMFGRHD